MGWISGLFTLLGVIKELIPLGIALLKYIHDEEVASQRKQLAQDIKVAVTEASKTGDTSQLENIFGKKENTPPISPHFQ